MMNATVRPDKDRTKYDYTNQAWVVDGKYVRCGHLPVNCPCYGTVHEGETPDEANCDLSEVR